MKEDRPWGNFTVIFDGDFKVKVLEVLPGRRLSYQRHSHRLERWTVAEGTASVTLDGEETDHGVGEVIFVERKQKHRLSNRTDHLLRVVEVQIGDRLEEDDIERFQDDYGRS